MTRSLISCIAWWSLHIGLCEWLWQTMISSGSSTRSINIPSNTIQYNRARLAPILHASIRLVPIVRRFAIMGEVGCNWHTWRCMMSVYLHCTMRIQRYSQWSICNRVSRRKQHCWCWSVHIAIYMLSFYWCGVLAFPGSRQFAPESSPIVQGRWQDSAVEWGNKKEIMFGREDGPCRWVHGASNDVFE